MHSHTLRSSLCALGLLASASAQFPCIIQDANAAYTFNGPGTNCGTAGGTSNFAANAIDHLYQHWWYLSVDGNGAACTLNDLPIGNITADCSGLGGRKGTLRVTDWDGTGKVSALWEVWVYSTDSTTGLIASRMKLTNTSSAPVTLRLFGYVDVDNGGATGDTAMPLAGWPAGNHVVTDTSLPVQVYVTALNYQHWEIDTYPLLRTALRNVGGATPYVLRDSNNMNPVPGDHTSAFQWDASLAPAADLTVWIAIGIDRQPSCQQPARSAAYCVAKAGSNGLPAWSLAPQPFTGGQMPLTITNGLTGSSPIAVLGTGTSNIVFPPVGTICVNPIAVSFPLAPFDGSGNSSTRIPLPGSPSVCGASLFVQAFFADAGAAGGIAHTEGLGLTFGSF